MPSLTMGHSRLLTTAARGVLADLSDRRGIKWELGKVEHDIRKEIVQSLADIIRLAQATKGDE